MGLFKRNTPAPCYRHRSPIDSRDLDGTVSGSLAAFKFAISAGLKKQIRFFSERSPTPSDSFISKNEGMAKVWRGKGELIRIAWFWLWWSSQETLRLRSAVRLKKMPRRRLVERHQCGSLSCD